MSFTVEVAGTSYSLLEPPDASSEIVISKKQDIEGSIVLHKFAQELTNLSCLIQFSYFGIAKNGDIEDKVQDLMTSITGLCEKWSFLISQYIAESNRTIQCMQNIYLYVCEGNESTAEEMISGKDFEISQHIITETELIQEELDDEVEFIQNMQKEFREAKKRVNVLKKSNEEFKKLNSRQLEIESKLKEEKDKLTVALDKNREKYEEKRRKISEEANAMILKIEQDQSKELHECDKKINSFKKEKQENEHSLSEIQHNLALFEAEQTKDLQSWAAFLKRFPLSKFNRDKQERERRIAEYKKKISETEKDITHRKKQIQALEREKQLCTNGSKEKIQAIKRESALKIDNETKSEDIEMSKIQRTTTLCINSIEKELEKANRKISAYYAREKNVDHIKLESKLIDLAKQLKRCRDKEQEEDVALECLAYALKSLDHLQNIMKKISMFWRNAHASIKRITQDDESLSKRLKKGSSTICIKDNKPFQTESLHYNAKWIAFREICQNAQKSFMAVEEQLLKTSRINVAKEEAIQTALQLLLD